MSESNTVLPHELLASTEYWANPQPGLPMRATLIQTKELWHGAFHPEVGQTIGRYVFDMTAGFNQVDVPDGNITPIPDDNSREVVKVVVDTRIVRPRKTSKPQYKDIDESLAAFDGVATQMTDKVLYWGPAAAVTLPSGVKGFEMGLRRTALYLRASRASGFLAGLTSRAFDQEGELLSPATFALPADKVGVVYRDTLSPVRSRIVSAQVLEPTGVAWHRHKGDDDNRKKEPRRLLRPGWFPSPLPAPGY